MNALHVLCAQLTRDLFAIAKFLLTIYRLLLHCWYSLGRPATNDDWYTNGHFCADLTAFDCFWRLVHCWYSLGRHVTIGTPIVIFAVLTVFDDWYIVGTLLVQPCRHVTIGTPMVLFAVLTVFWLFLTIGTPLVHCWYSLGRPVTIGILMVLSVFDDW